MNKPKISVIIPVYKVEPYLRKCLVSVVGQTYQNLEIILVDDGSPDNSGTICDEYAAKDNRKATREQYWPEVQEIAQFSKIHYRAALKYLGLGRVGKMVVCLTPYTGWWAFFLADLCGWVYRLRHGREL